MKVECTIIPPVPPEPKYRLVLDLSLRDCQDLAQILQIVVSCRLGRGESLYARQNTICYDIIKALRT